MAGTDPRTHPPRDDEFELSLIGPGYGECLVMHFGDGDWAVVDSCVDVRSRRPVALDYLDVIGIDPSAIRLVVATHWHDDHIRGLHDVLKAASKARFVFSMALRSQEFATLVSLVEPRMMLRSSGVVEFAKVYAYLTERKAPPTFASANRRVWKPAGKLRRELWALSPSDRSVELALQGIAGLTTDPDLPNRRVPALTPNHASVVLWGEVPTAAVLLGGDLEETADADTGWSAIVASPERPTGKADVFKVPHHGSITGHSDDVWREMLRADAITVVTPFARGKTPLPTADDVKRLASLTKNVYVSSNQMPPMSEWPPAVEATLAEVTVSIADAEPPPGHVRLRRDTSGGEWTVELFAGAARQ